MSQRRKGSIATDTVSRTSKASKLTVASRRERRARLARLAEPKSVPPPLPDPPRQQKYLGDLIERVSVLAQPREYALASTRPLGSVSPDALNYQITEPILKLATNVPKRFNERRTSELPGKVRPEALHAEASERVKQLAVPKHKREKVLDSDTYSLSSYVKPSALKAVPTDRVKELATPKHKKNKGQEDVWSVSPSALKYIATARINKLAQPRL